ncbi:MAG: hypothetical protein M3083_09440 [Actinomycetota bacterium]|nr:hypothetical protein [Actinomycetota bacterium]MDQ6945234.1 hypothetical protein [Actinomycetota bacterium]
MTRGRLVGIFGLGAAIAAAMITAGTAWACISGPALTLSASQGTAGMQVSFTGTNFGSDPAVVHFNALTGPVLATAIPDKDGKVTGTFAIPAGTTSGTYVIVVTQEAAGKITQVPSRAVFNVVGDNGTPVASGTPVAGAAGQRPIGLAHGSSVSVGATILVGVGVGGAALLIAGLASFLTSRRHQEPAPVASQH